MFMINNKKKKPKEYRYKWNISNGNPRMANRKIQSLMMKSLMKI